MEKNLNAKLKRMISHKFRQMCNKEAKLAVPLIYWLLAFSRTAGSNAASSLEANSFIKTF